MKLKLETNFYHSIITERKGSRRETIKRREEKEKWNDKKNERKRNRSPAKRARGGINSSRKVVGQFRGSLSAET